MRNSTMRVPCPRQTGSTPVASGSSVPACPARRSPVRRFTVATTPKDVLPGGLLILSIPSKNLPDSSPGFDFAYAVEGFLYFRDREEQGRPHIAPPALAEIGAGH